MLATLKRILVGRPLASDEQEHQRLSKKIALAVFSSDAISSTAYATQEILVVTAVGASSLQLGLSRLVPIAIAVAVLLAIVVTSYRQTIFAYPGGGGSYVVSRENLGEYPSLVAAASLLIDYTLTVAVSVSAGVAAIISIPTFQRFADQRVEMALILIFLITLANLRGAKESGRIFAAPTYAYVGILAALIGYGLFREFVGPQLDHIEADHFVEEGGRLTGGSLGLLVLLKGFSSGAVALTGVEAISNGVPQFKRPESKNAAATMVWMGLILGTLFLGVSVLAHHLEPFPSEAETAFSQMGRTVFGTGPLYLFLQFATAGILTLAANTAYAGFPSLSSLIARDGYLPRQLANRGDRLVFSNGVLFLTIVASLLIIAFEGDVSALIPLYAVGVFTSFTLSQAGMVRHHLRHKLARWRAGVAVNSLGALATFIVLLIVGGTKFTSGAWVPIVVVPCVMAIFIAIKRHYAAVRLALKVHPDMMRPQALNHTVIVLVGRIHRGVIKALSYAKSLNPNHLAAVYVSYDDEDSQHMQEKWQQFGFDIPLEIIHSPYRELLEPIEKYLKDLDERWNDDTVTIVIPEFVVDHWYENLLHNQSAFQLKLALLGRRNTVVTSVPYHVRSEPNP